MTATAYSGTSTAHAKPRRRGKSTSAEVNALAENVKPDTVMPTSMLTEATSLHNERKERHRNGTHQGKGQHTTCPEPDNGVAVGDGDREITNVRLAVKEALAAAMLFTAIGVDVAAMLVLFETPVEEAAAATLEVVLGDRAGLPLTLNSVVTGAEGEPVIVSKADLELVIARDAVEESEDGVAVGDALVTAPLADGDEEEGGGKEVP